VFDTATPPLVINESLKANSVVASGAICDLVNSRRPFLNVHKIRVDSDNKRCARCTRMVLTQSRKVNINEYINNMESA
jgi:hypothetical protein